MHLRPIALGVLCFLGAASLSCLPTVEGQDYNLAGQDVRLTLLHTSDIHSRLVPYEFAPNQTDIGLGLLPEAAPFGGATRIAALLKREREKTDRALHLDSGDCFQGAPIYNVNHGEAEFRFLSQVRLDAAVIGNHEFDSGLQNFVEKARDHANFPLLAANYAWDDPKAPGNHQTALQTEPYTILNIKGLRVGVIGMANISSLNSIVEGGNSLQVTPIEQNEAARGYVELLKPVTDLVVLVSHLGLTEDQWVIKGYDAFFEYGRIKSFVERDYAQWTVLEWVGPEGKEDSIVKVRIPGVSGVDAIMGGHLHVVLNPPQTIKDPSGRDVLIVHSGAFAKFLGRADVVVHVPGEGEDTSEGGEIVSHDYYAFPLDALWCNDELRASYLGNTRRGDISQDPTFLAAIDECRKQEDRLTTQLMQPYLLGMDFNLQLTSVFAYAPRDMNRRSETASGDSPLGNISADSMRKRKRVEAELALTNSLGIRDNLYTGPISQESMFNVFPFENTINIMYLSGLEIQEMFNYVADHSAERGCQSQAQISGATFVMDCAQAKLNERRFPCDLAQRGNDCPAEDRAERDPWQCLSESADQTTGTGHCWANAAHHIRIAGKPVDANGMYKIAVNDYIAKGGSGFTVLKRNTTRVETGISLRESLIGYVQSFCSCEDYLAGREFNAAGVRCGNLREGQHSVDEDVLAFCQETQKYQAALLADAAGCSCLDVLRGNTDRCGGTISNEQRAQCAAVPPGPPIGSCTCKDILSNAPQCKYSTPQVKAFCESPTSMAIAVSNEEPRIVRRIK